ncbi:hypothetical protein L0244_40040, partial [bacterium]|nr:hypothetical protein [bacterium]
RSTVKAQEDLNGLYHVISESKDYKFSDLVLCYKCESIPPKGNDPDAPRTPGFYYEDIRYRFANVIFKKGVIQFQTESVNHIKFHFTGNLEMKADPGFDPHLLLRSLNGTLEKVVNDQIKQTDKIIFGEDVIY